MVSMSLRRGVIRVLACLAAVGVFTPGLLAQSKTWNGSVDSSWSTANNWTPAGVPGPADTVLIPAGAGSVVTSGTIVVASADIRRPITVNGSFTAATTLDSAMTLQGMLSGSLAAKTGAQINSQPCSGQLSNLAVSTESTLALTGTTRWNNVASTGTIRVGNSASVLIDGNQTITGTLEFLAFIGPGSNGSSIVPFRAGTLTVAPGATIRGSGVVISATGNGACGDNGTLNIVNNGTVEGTRADSPILLGASIVGGVGTLRGNVDVLNSIANTTITAETNTTGYPRLLLDCNDRLDNVTFAGDLLDYRGSAIWNNVSATGKIQMRDGAALLLDGNQTITGTLEFLAFIGPGSNGSSIVPFRAGTLTVAPGATIRGSGVVISATGNGACGDNGTLNIVNNGTVEGTRADSPILLGASIVGGVGTLRGNVDVLNSIANTTITAETNTTGYPRLLLDCNDRLDNVTFAGDLLDYRGSAIWNNVSATGKIQMRDGAALLLDGNQTITGTLEFLAFIGPGSNGSSIVPFRAGTLTVAPGATIRGSGVVISATANGACGGTGTLNLVNSGTIHGTNASSPINITSPLLNLGSITGFVQVNGGNYGSDWTVATPSQPATVTTSRPDPGSGSSQTLSYREMYIAPGANFTLGSGETLNLNNGTGTLNVGPGAIFTSNGTVIGNIYNAGLVIIPITNVSSAGQITGPGTVMVGVGGAAGAIFGWSGAPAGSQAVLVPDSPTVSSSPTVSGSVIWDGQLDVTGTYTQTPTGVMRLFIAGNVQGETYSFLNVGQSATLAGGLQIVLQPDPQGFVPSVGETFEMVYAEGGLLINPPGLAITSLMTRAGAQQLGLSLPTFNSGFAGDPNDLVQLPANIFSYQLLPDGKTLRVTLTAPVCGTTLSVGGSFVCPQTPASFTANTAGSGPFTYVWSYRGRNGQPPTEWTVITEGANTPGGVGSGVAFNAAGATGRTLTLTRTGGSWPLFGNGSAGEVRCEIVGPCGPAEVTGLFGVVGSKCLPADLARDDGTFLPPFGPCDTQFPNAGVNEGDYNAFFSAEGFFYQASLGAAGVGMSCDIADDQGVALPPFDTGGTTAANNGVNEGDYNVFFNTLFLPCS